MAGIIIIIIIIIIKDRSPTKQRILWSKIVLDKLIAA
jgi:hypothetical protein